MKVTEIITEAPITDYEPLGDFKKPGSFNDQRDKNLIQNQKYEQKLYKFFAKTGADFRIFPVNYPGLRKFQERGEVTPQFIQQTFAKHPEIAEKILSDVDSDAITIVYVSNTGTNKVVMTPWIMAHRFGHAIVASRGNAAHDAAWKYVEDYFFGTIHEILSTIYRVNIQSEGYDRRYDQYYTGLFHAIGTQRSSRRGLLQRPYEFLYELFAQFLKTGKIKLNMLPSNIPYGSSKWGRKNSMTASPDVPADDVNDDIYGLMNTMPFLFEDVLSACMNHIFVM
jgi:hypothetical protein